MTQSHSRDFLADGSSRFRTGWHGKTLEMGNLTNLCSRGEEPDDVIATPSSTPRRRYRSFYLPTSPANVNDAFAECFVGKQPSLLEGGDTLHNMATREADAFIASESFASAKSRSSGSSLLTDSADARSFDSVTLRELPPQNCRCHMKVGSEVQQP